jgi:hypothetical protein
MQRFQNRLQRPHIDRIFLVLIIALSGFNLFIGVRTVFCKLTFQLGSEFNTIYTVQHTLATGSIYTNPAEFPFALAQKPPFYYLLAASSAKILGFTPGMDARYIVSNNRMLSFLAGLGIMFLVYWICRKIAGANRLFSLAAVAICFMMPMPWYFLSRADAWAALFIFASIATYLLAIKRPSWWMLTLCGALTWMAFLTKQHGLIAFVIILLFSLLSLRWKDSIFITIGFFLACVITSITFQSFYSLFPVSDNYIYRNIINGLDNGIDFRKAYELVFQPYLHRYGGLLLITLAGIAYQFIHHPIRQINRSLLFIISMFIFLSGFMSLSALKVGSEINYLNESLILSVIIVVFTWTELSREDQLLPIKPIAKTVAILCLAVFLVVISFEKFVSFGETYAISCYNRSDVYQSNLVKYLQIELDDHPGAYLFTTFRMLNNFFYDRVVFPQSDTVKSNLFAGGVFDYSEFQAAVNDGRVRYLVFSEGDELSSFAGVPFDGFIRLTNLNGYTILVNPAKP